MSAAKAVLAARAAGIQLGAEGDEGEEMTVSQ